MGLAKKYGLIQKKEPADEEQERLIAWVTFIHHQLTNKQYLMNIRTLKQNKTMHPCDSHLRKVIDEMLRNDYALLESPNKPSVILECLTARNDQIIRKYIDTVAFEYSFPDPSLQLHLH